MKMEDLKLYSDWNIKWYGADGPKIFLFDIHSKHTWNFSLQVKGRKIDQNDVLFAVSRSKMKRRVIFKDIFKWYNVILHNIL